MLEELEEANRPIGVNSSVAARNEARRLEVSGPYLRIPSVL